MRDLCTRHAFDGCAGDGGSSCHHCPGRAEALNAAVANEHGRSVTLMGLFAIALPISILMWAAMIVAVIHILPATS